MSRNDIPHGEAVQLITMMTQYKFMQTASTSRLDRQERGTAFMRTSLWSFPTLYNVRFATSSTYDHRILKIELPVRSAVLKQDTGGLVVRWVTTSEYPLLYVFAGLAVILGGGKMW
jgi:hypothetical protein